jgi:hypothetical protein
MAAAARLIFLSCASEMEQKVKLDTIEFTKFGMRFTKTSISIVSQCCWRLESSVTRSD